MIGGAERYLFNLGSLLKSRGHRVAYFSTKDKGNQKTKWDKHFIEKLDFKTKSLENSMNKFPRMFYSTEAKQKISLLLDKFKPDVVHLQNIYYYISPSILSEIKKREIPIVQTVHDYQLISPSVIMYHDGEICEVCKKNRYYKALFHKCVKKSYIATLMSVVTLYFQRINNFYINGIDIFITPSLFTKRKLIEYGLPKNKIVQINNFLFKQEGIKFKSFPKKYVLYFGRICEAKGIFTLLEAALKLPRINFKVAGDFEDENVKLDTLNKINEKNIKNIEILDFKSDTELKKVISQSLFVIVPSLWYENQPYSVLESFALGRPVVASNIGGIPELVHSGKNGILFKPGDAGDLAKAIEKLWKNHSLRERLGKNAQRLMLERHSANVHYQKVVAIYRSLAKKR